MRIILIILISLFYSESIEAQAQIPHSQHTEISIVTCNPGNSIDETFGHSAVRVKDDSLGYDFYFNYGVFSPSTENFALKFLRGKLLYSIGGGRFNAFHRSYQISQRDMREQVLNLSPEEVANVFQAIQEDIKPENRDYYYDFYFDNCVTRIRDVLAEHVDGLDYPTETYEKLSFRDLIHEYTDRMPWTQFGMDLILGSDNDKITRVEDQMFLPDYFESYLTDTKTSRGSLVQSQETLLAYPTTHRGASFFTPTVVFSILLIIEITFFILLYISGEPSGWWKLDQIWFALTSICALIFLFMWFLTDHEVCSKNWNLLWTTPWMLLYYYLDENSRLKRGLVLLTVLSCVIVILSPWVLPQQFSTGAVFISSISLIKGLRLMGIFKILDKVIRHSTLTTAMVLIAVLGYSQEKIGGLTVVAPPQEYTTDPMPAVAAVNANWIALVPFAFNSTNNPKVSYGSSGQWWGERKEGVIESIRLAKAQGLHIMLKPQVWMRGAWVGDMDFSRESDWKIWEDSFRDYIMTFVDIAIEHDVEMICVGTEFRNAVKEREQFWRNLIREIRSKYSGKLTYSANWDDYEKVPFWDMLDFIGISAYFPLSEYDTPNQYYLSFRWNKTVNKLEKYSKKIGRPILFTEYGYLSVDGAAGKTWLLEKKVHDLDINEKAQANALGALYSAFWDEDWWMGGFLWKWFPNGQGHEGYPERDYTPQGKLGQDVVAKWYKKTDRK